MGAQYRVILALPLLRFGWRDIKKVRRCEHCQGAYIPRCLQQWKFCTNRCAGASHRKRTKGQRNAYWREYHGNRTKHDGGYRAARAAACVRYRKRQNEKRAAGLIPAERLALEREQRIRSELKRARKEKRLHKGPVCWYDRT